MKRTHLFRVTLALCLLTVALPARSQDSQQEEQVPTFKAGVDVVNIFFVVKDKHGTLIPNLKKEDFHVSEDAKPQTVKYFSAETNLPLTLGLLIDTSGSMAAVLPMEKEIGGAFVRQIMREKDLAFLINFDVNVELAQDMTSSSRDIARTLNEFKINTGGGAGGVPGIGQGPIPIHHPRGTALYDAVYLAANDKLASEVGRKAMIILTDGVDNGSKVNLKDAIEAAQRADTICYVLLVSDPMMPRDDRDMGKLAEDTGGRLIDVGSKPERMKDAFDRVSQELRSQYSLGYSPTNTKKDGTFRKIEIKTLQGKVQARKGYYALK
jgi:VWFA-related protein